MGRNGRTKILQIQPNAPFKVTEIIRPKPITRVRGTPSFVPGVIHHCGREIPIVDVRLKLGMEATECSEESRVVVLHIDNVEMGLLVDQVLGEGDLK